MSFKFNAAEVFNIAIKIEENGKKFYDASLKVIQDPGVRKLFADLAEQEVEHKKRFEALKAQLPKSSTVSTVWDPDNELDRYIKMMADEHVFVTSAGLDQELARVTDVKSALRLAIEFEKDSVIFFLGLEDATVSKQDQELIKALVKEEQEHLRRLSLELSRISR
ncbi:ferritin-like domain-containing protein [Syntrophobacter fumaroxidans]|uniref:Rubrerythrin n=1 Tax=Syntrophobacter fumaroxidans (strain DSM 10017 / MPOB) TaxID=335543 RepID=A0LN91_SYNFM|nr:ferritin family protein [Syntrophobacter fumaroxidans]ABK18893.1 Rubrerythrin [Syntrophobacter fumaroxidans MPOB]